MNRRVMVGLVAALAVGQLAVPASMIAARETVMRTGQEYKIHVIPVDPYDAFRGRYVQLGFDPITAPLPPGVQVAHDQTAYAELEKDAEGFVVVKRVTFTRPESSEYLKVRSLWSSEAGMGKFAWPFDRYYMEETVAPEAERVYQQRARTASAYVTVRVLNGMGVITGLYIDGQAIEKIVKG